MSHNLWMFEIVLLIILWTFYKASVYFDTNYVSKTLLNNRLFICSCVIWVCYCRKWYHSSILVWVILVWNFIFLISFSYHILIFIFLVEDSLSLLLYVVFSAFLFLCFFFLGIGDSFSYLTSWFNQHRIRCCIRFRVFSNSIWIWNSTTLSKVI